MESLLVWLGKQMPKSFHLYQPGQKTASNTWMNQKVKRACVSADFWVESFSNVLNIELQSVKEGLLLQACCSQFCNPYDTSDMNDEHTSGIMKQGSDL